MMSRKSSIKARAAGANVVTLSCLLVPAIGAAQQAPPAKVCAPSDRWFQCSEKVKQTIQATSDVEVALAAASEWADRYEALYKANAQSSWPWSDQEMLRKAIEKLYDEALGKYLDPAALAFAMALAKYLPRLAAVVEFAGGAAMSGFVVLIAPSPIANDFTQAGPDNKRINDLLKSKLPPTTVLTIQQKYPELVNKAYIEVRAAKKVVKP
jgi:hypothetical protein